MSIDTQEPAIAPGPPPGPWAPLRVPIFRAIWMAAIASNVGTWIQDVGAAWLMTSLTTSPLYVALVKVANSVPMFLLALPAGALADLFDRRSVLLVTQTWMLVTAASLALLTYLGLVTPPILLLLIFSLGIGFAANGPAWQAMLPELVPREQLASAVALQSVSINAARSVGPAIGGVIVALAGPAAAFFFNALSFLGVIGVLGFWRRDEPVSALPRETMRGAMRAGFRFARNSPAIRAVLVRVAAYILPASALWSLLPALARHELATGATGYGLLLASMGTGALSGAWLLSLLRRRYSADRIVTGGTLLIALCTLGLANSTALPLALAIMFPAGIAWVLVLANLNTAAQTVAPQWVRARVLSIYLFVFFSCMAGGSFLWGMVANHYGVPSAFIAGATVLALGSLTSLRYRLAEGEGVNVSPSRHWPTPLVYTEPEPDRGPVIVTIEYRIADENRTAFIEAMRRLRMARMRSGGYRWELVEDAAQPGRYLEMIWSPSWAEHLRQHERVTASDRVIQEAADAYHEGDEPPIVTHWLG